MFKKYKKQTIFMLIHGTYVSYNFSGTYKGHLICLEYGFSGTPVYPDHLKVLKLNHHKTNNIKMIIITE